MVSILLILSTVSTLCLAGLITRTLKRPINRLLEGQKHIRHGNIKYRLSVEGNQELQLLFAGFNKMAEGIEEATRQEQTLVEQKSFTKLASQIIHDLRSPLASLKVASQSLAAQETTNPELAKIIKIINLGTNRLEEIASSLLVKNKEMKTNDLSLHEVLDELLEEFISHNRFPMLFIEKRYSSSPIIIKAAKQDIQRAIVNIVTNAIEAMNGNGKLAIQTELQNNLITLKLEDTVPGLKNEILQKILQGGFSYNKVNGNGIGMTVVREVVEKYNGTLEAMSTEGVGTTFFLKFPSAI